MITSQSYLTGVGVDCPAPTLILRYNSQRFVLVIFNFDYEAALVVYLKRKPFLDTSGDLCGLDDYPVSLYEWVIEGVQFEAYTKLFRW